MGQSVPDVFPMNDNAAPAEANLFAISVRTLSGEETTLERFSGQVLLIVNVASRCGFTPQYEGLEELHRKYSDQGLAVLGFPCNQFGGQEPGDAQEIRSFCDSRFGVSFPLFEKVEVNGAGAHPLYRHLKTEAPGVLNTQAIKWNFTKFLVDRRGNVVERFSPATKPSEIENRIKDLLNAAVSTS